MTKRAIPAEANTDTIIDSLLLVLRFFAEGVHQGNFSPADLPDARALRAREAWSGAWTLLSEDHQRILQTWWDSWGGMNAD